MSNEEIKQRIAYLIEHGGVWDDPLAEIRKHIRQLYYLATIGVIALAFDVIVTFVL